MTCPECGNDDARISQTIRYPRGTTTLILDCPHCVRLVLLDGSKVSWAADAASK